MHIRVLLCDSQKANIEASYTAGSIHSPVQIPFLRCDFQEAVVVAGQTAVPIGDRCCSEECDMVSQTCSLTQTCYHANSDTDFLAMSTTGVITKILTDKFL